MSFWGSLFGGGVGAYGYNELMGDLQNQRGDTAEGINYLQQGASDRSQFQPWSITGGMGGGVYGDEGGIHMDMTERQKDIRRQMSHGGTDLLGMAQAGSMDPAARTSAARR